VEQWLRSLPLANGSRAKIRNLMHAIFNHAVRWEWHDRNPITHVRQSAKRQRVPVVLSIDQIHSLVANLKEPGKTAVLVDILTGLRVSELLAPKWSDVDFENLELHVTRSIALQHVTQVLCPLFPGDNIVRGFWKPMNEERPKRCHWTLFL
jgi:integrase